jgi:hypothetical protein
MENAQIVRLEDWMDAEAWRAASGKTVFPSEGSWLWFKRTNRRELVESGALILGRGRLCDIVDTKRIGAAVQSILQKESMRIVNKSVEAA